MRAVKYIVDCGDRCVVMTERKLRRYYNKRIENNVALCGYPSYDDWLMDMCRMALVTAIIG